MTTNIALYSLILVLQDPQTGETVAEIHNDRAAYTLAQCNDLIEPTIQVHKEKDELIRTVVCRPLVGTST